MYKHISKPERDKNEHNEQDCLVKGSVDDDLIWGPPTKVWLATM